MFLFPSLRDNILFGSFKFQELIIYYRSLKNGSKIYVETLVSVTWKADMRIWQTK